MRPAPVQHPRPPLTIAAHGRVTLKIAAERGDSWNSAPVAGRDMLEGKGLSVGEALEVTQRRSELLDEQCVGVGRDPSTIRRSICAVPPPYTLDTPWISTTAFEEFVERYRRIGITEFIFMCPLEDYYPADQVQPGIFERIATQVIPAIQRSA